MGSSWPGSIRSRGRARMPSARVRGSCRSWRGTCPRKRTVAFGRKSNRGLVAIMKQGNFVYFVPSLILSMLAGCTQPGAPAKSSVRPDAASTVAAIRSAGSQFDSSVEVHALRDPAIDGLLQQAHQQEAQQQPDQALASVRKALTIAPNAPDLLQLQAELAIETGDWTQATT